MCLQTRPGGGNSGVSCGVVSTKGLRSRLCGLPPPILRGREKTQAARAGAAFFPLPSSVGEGPGPRWLPLLGCLPAMLSARPRSGTCPDLGHHWPSLLCDALVAPMCPCVRLCTAPSCFLATLHCSPEPRPNLLLWKQLRGPAPPPGRRATIP